MEHFRLFVLPFWLGALFLLVALLYKYILWFVKLEPAQRRMFFRSLPTRATLRSLGEIASESLLHRKIWRRNNERIHGEIFRQPSGRSASRICGV